MEKMKYLKDKKERKQIRKKSKISKEIKENVMPRNSVSEGRTFMCEM